MFLTDAVEGRVRWNDGAGEPVGGQAWATTPTPRDIVQKAPVGGSSDRRPTVAFETDGPWPATLLAIRADVNANP